MSLGQLLPAASEAKARRLPSSGVVPGYYNQSSLSVMLSCERSLPPESHSSIIDRIKLDINEPKHTSTKKKQNKKQTKKHKKQKQKTNKQANKQTKNTRLGQVAFESPFVRPELQENDLSNFVVRRPRSNETKYYERYLSLLRRN